MPEQTEQTRPGLYNTDKSAAKSKTSESSVRSSGPLSVKPPKPPITSKGYRRNDTIGFLLDELQDATVIPETFEAVDRTLPEPPATAVLRKAVANCQAKFLDLDTISKSIQDSREYFLESFCGLANETQREECAVSMLEFEQRIITSFPHNAEFEIHSSYKQLCRLLIQEPNERSLPWQTRLLAVSHFLTHAAKPETLSQGSKIGAHAICILHKLASSQPSRLASMLASASFDGRWQTFDGKTVTLDEHTLKPGPEELLYKPGDNRRSYAAKILKSLLLNDCLLRRSTAMTYAENPGRPGRDSAGQLVHTLDGKAVNPRLGANLGYFELALLAHFEFGLRSCVIVNDLAFSESSAEFLDQNQQKFLVHIESIQELSQALLIAREFDSLPVMIAVDERRLLAEQYNDGINHIVNVVAYSESGLLKIFNPQLLPGMPRVARLSLQKLYNATLSKTKS